VGRGGVGPDVNLDPFGDPYPAPGGGWLVVVCGDEVGFGEEGGLEGAGNAPFEGVTSDALHFDFDFLERLPFALADLDGQELEQMPVVVRCGRPGPFGAVDQPGGDVKTDRASTRCGTSRRICRPQAGGVYEAGGVGGEATSVPGGMFCVSPEESNRRFSHVDRIALNSSARSSCGRSPAGERM